MSLLFTIWNNGKPSEDDGRPQRFLKDVKCQSLERLGDTQIRALAQLELPKIMGRENHVLNTMLMDHANSNLFYEAVTKHYKLDTQVKWPPMECMGNTEKLRANIFEAWIGAHVYERMQYDDKDPLSELRSFFNRLWSIRYGFLHRYRYKPTFNRACIPSGSVKDYTISDVECKTDSEMKRTLGLFMEAPNVINRVIGHIVQVTMNQDEDDFKITGNIPEADSKMSKSLCHTSFARSKSEAQQMANLLLWTRPGTD